MGPYYLAAGLNNVVWYYCWLDQKRNGVIKGGDLTQKKEFLGNIKQVCINGYWSAVLCDQKVTLFPIDPESAPKDFKEKRFPMNDQDKSIY